MARHVTRQETTNINLPWSAVRVTTYITITRTIDAPSNLATALHDHSSAAYLPYQTLLLVELILERKSLPHINQNGDMFSNRQVPACEQYTKSSAFCFESPSSTSLLPAGPYLAHWLRHSRVEYGGAGPSVTAQGTKLAPFHLV